MDLALGFTRLIIDACKKQGLLRNQAAYVLATAYWESARTMKPVREMGGEKYLKSKPYYPYVGMGFVQLTWLANYEKASKKLGVDFVKNPKLLLEPGYAATILVIGSAEGWFTGKKLSDYITLGKSDFINARRIINGTDKAKEIAAIAKKYDALLLAEGYEAISSAKPEPKPIAADLTVKQVNSVMHLGSKGDFVKTLQENLNKLGYPHIEPDGIFGDDTDTAVRAFQTDAKLVRVDGWAGPATVAAISKELEKRKTAPKIEAASKVVDDAASGGNFSKTEVITTITGVTGTATVVKEGVDAVRESTSSFMDLASTVGPWVLLAVVLASGAAYIVYDRRRKRLEAQAVKKVL